MADSAKIRAKLNEIKIDRTPIEAGLTTTADQLSLGAGMLRDVLHLVANPHQLYRDGNSQVRRNLNDTVFQKLYIDYCEVIRPGSGGVHRNVRRRAEPGSSGG
jgi:hypothetical protein